MSSFISDEEFNHRVLTKQFAKDAMHWEMLPINVVYRVKTRMEMELEHNTVLQLVNRENKEVKVQAPRNIANDLTIGMEIRRKEAYIRSLGRKERKFQGKKIEYFDFETVYLPKDYHAKPPNAVMNEEQSEDRKLGKVRGEKQVKVTDAGKKRKAIVPVPELAAKNSKVDIERLIDGSGILIK